MSIDILVAATIALSLFALPRLFRLVAPDSTGSRYEHTRRNSKTRLTPHL
jgi:hypothetical protein